jgi:hypothetical protein
MSREWIEVFDGKHIGLVTPTPCSITHFRVITLLQQDPTTLTATVCSQEHPDDGAAIHRYPIAIEAVVPYLEGVLNRKFCQEKFEVAEKVTEWDSWIYASGYNIANSECYFRSVTELREMIEKYNAEHPGPDEQYEMPRWVFCTEPCHLYRSSAKDLFEESFVADVYNEAWKECETRHKDAIEELDRALDQFYAATSNVCTFQPDYNKVLIISA